jgi:hypothetical protein
MSLVYRVWCGLATGQPPAGLVDVLDELLPDLRRLRGEAWLEQQARTMRPREVRRLTSGVARRAAAGDPEALGIVAERIAARIPPTGTVERALDWGTPEERALLDRWLQACAVRSGT